MTQPVEDDGATGEKYDDGKHAGNRDTALPRPPAQPTGFDSSVIYREHARHREALHALASAFFHPVGGWGHYRSMAKQNVLRYLQGYTLPSCLS